MSLNVYPFPPVEEKLHGVEVSDPYRWLERRDLPETEQWLGEQDRRCRAYFAGCRNLAPLERRVRDYLDVTVADQPARIGNRYFYRRRDKGQEQGSIYVREVATGEERLLVNPMKDGPFASVGIYRISEDGCLLAFEIAMGGEDRKKIHILDIEGSSTIATIPLGYARGFAFAADGDGYFYAHETGVSKNEHTIWRHRFSDMGSDEAVFRVPATAGSRLLLIANEKRLGALCLRLRGHAVVAELSITSLRGELSWTAVFAEKTVPYNPILCHDRILVLREDHSNGSQLVELSQEGEELRTVVPPGDTPIRQCAITRDQLFVSYLNHGVTTIEAWDFDGHQDAPVDVPCNGTVRMLPAQSQDTDGFFYTHQSFDTPLTIFEYSSQARSSKLWNRRDVPLPSRPYRVRDVDVTSKDGTSIPMTLVSKQSDQAVSPTSVIMTSYGGFGVATTPQFSVLVAIMIDLGATLAIPHIRGGGEFGRAWHDAGRGRNKQVAFDDFIAAAEWLCGQRLTIPKRLAIFGGSNSGLLVGAVMTQRPKLFGAVLCVAPLLDMIRYEYFDDAAIWRHEYGTTEDPDDFRSLYSYSPYHHVRKEWNYPAALFVSGDKDDRCNPAHVRKMVALMQGRTAQISPVILDYNEQRGHAPVLPLSMRAHALARRIAFLCRQLDISPPDGGDCETVCA